jgi:hypothetical protein
MRPGSWRQTVAKCSTSVSTKRDDAIAVTPNTCTSTAYGSHVVALSHARVGKLIPNDQSDRTEHDDAARNAAHPSVARFRGRQGIESLVGERESMGVVTPWPVRRGSQPRDARPTKVARSPLLAQCADAEADGAGRVGGALRRPRVAVVEGNGRGAEGPEVRGASEKQRSVEGIQRWSSLFRLVEAFLAHDRQGYCLVGLPVHPGAPRQGMQRHHSGRP